MKVIHVCITTTLMTLLKKILTPALLVTFGTLIDAAPTDGSCNPAGASAIALFWNDNSSDETGFLIERHNGDGNWTTAAIAPKNTTSFYDRNLLNTSTYHYRVSEVGTADSSSLPLGSATTTIKMNIIFFLADDMGYKDIVALRNPEIDGPTIYETPALDAIVNQGLSIDNAYCSGPRCVVARRALLTGKYDWRPEATPNNDWYLDHDGDKIGGGIFAGGTSINSDTTGQTIPDNVTFGEAVQAAGYRTCYIGKYHLGESATTFKPTGYNFGDQPGRGPIHQGFDVSIASGHAGAPPASYFALQNQNANAPTGEFTFELPDLDDTRYMLNPAAPVAGDYITDRLTDKGIGFIDDVVNNHDTQPFFLTLAHYAVHTPAEAKDNASSTDGKGYEYFQSKKASMASQFAAHPAGASALITDYSVKTRVWQDNAVYAAMIKSYDESLGDIRAYLAATDDPRNPGLKLADTTVIIISSDHGGKSTTPLNKNDTVEAADGSDTVNPPAVHVPAKIEYKSGTPNEYSHYPTSNYPYRQGKTWVYEGGLKIPLIVYHPQLTIAGTHSNAFVQGADFFSTFVDIAGAPQQPNESTDSVSFMQTVADSSLTARNEIHHFFTNANEGTGNPAIAAYRKGDYKLLYFMVQRRLELYNVVSDIYEQNDLASSRPDLAAEMLKQVYNQFLTTGAKMPRPGSNTWQSEQKILFSNGLISNLPTPPTAAPTGLSITQLSKTALQLNWTANSPNATHAVIYRDGPDDDSYREIAYVPISQTTYIDNNFTSTVGEKYKYRIEEENLGGWNGFSIQLDEDNYEFSDGSSNNGTTNTGNVVHTLQSSPALPLTLTDDSITTTPGESRLCYPTSNDSGEGTLTITSITQPSVGSATTDGSTITYNAPANFAGAVTMTYSITDGASQTATATITFTLPVAQATLTLECWNFDESANTQLENTFSETGTAPFNTFNGTTSTNVITDGSGNLVLTHDTTNHNRDSNTVLGGPYTTGKYALEYTVTSADLTNAENGTAFGFSLRDGTTNDDFGIIRFKKVGSGITLEARVGSTTSTLHDFNADTITNVKVTSILNLNASPKTIETKISINNAAPINLPTVDANASASTFSLLKFFGGLNSTTGTFEAKIDSVKVLDANPQNELYTAWSSAFPWNGNKQTSPAQDADNDGVSNIIEFALGTSPTSPEQIGNPFSISNTPGSNPTFDFTPVRDTSLLNYIIEFSSDLSDWTSISPVQVTTPAGTPSSTSLPSGTNMFSRLKIEGAE